MSSKGQDNKRLRAWLKEQGLDPDNLPASTTVIRTPIALQNIEQQAYRRGVLDQLEKDREFLNQTVWPAWSAFMQIGLTVTFISTAITNAVDDRSLDVILGDMRADDMLSVAENAFRRRMDQLGNTPDTGFEEILGQCESWRQSIQSYLRHNGELTRRQLQDFFAEETGTLVKRQLALLRQLDRGGRVDEMERLTIARALGQIENEDTEKQWTAKGLILELKQRLEDKAIEGTIDSLESDALLKIRKIGHKDSFVSRLRADFPGDFLR